MPRTTLDLDGAVLRELKRRSRAQGTTAGRLASLLLARALDEPSRAETPTLGWHATPMHARVDLRDKEALRRALEGT
jgi:hypothetical protein